MFWKDGTQHVQSLVTEGRWHPCETEIVCVAGAWRSEGKHCVR